jgi:fibronectin-binding autotransporter adhesin
MDTQSRPPALGSPFGFCARHFFLIAMGMLAISIVGVAAAHGQTTNVWSGATSSSLTTTSNYQSPSSVQADGNPSATFVFGRVATTRSSLSATGEFKANRFEFESTAGRSFTLSSGNSYFNFVGTSNGIFQGSSQAHSLTTGIKISDGPLTLGGDGTGLVTLSGSTNNDFGGKGLTKTGSSTFFINANGIGSTGTVEINGGVLALKSGTTLSGGVIRLRGGVLAASGTFGRSLGTGNTNVNFGTGGGGFAAYGNPLTVSTGLGTWAGTNAVPNGAPLILGATIADNVVTLSGTLALGAAGNTREIRLIDNAASASDRAVMSGIVSGSAGLQITGTGSLTLSAANTFTGGLSVAGGTVRGTTSAGALGAGTVTLAGGSLELANNTGLNFARNTTVAQSGTIRSGRVAAGGGVTHQLGTLAIGASRLTLEADGTVTSGTAGLTFGAVTLSAGGAEFVSAGANTLLTLGAISGAGNDFTVDGQGSTSITGGISTTTGGLTKNGTGTLTLAGSNSFTGTTTLAGGSLVLGDPRALATSTVSVQGGSLGFGGLTAVTLGGLSGGGGITLTNASGEAVALSVGANGGTTTFSGILAGSGGLTKQGAGALTLAGANTFAGGTTIEGGEVRVAAEANLGIGSVTLAGGQLSAVESFTLGSGRPVVISAASTLQVAAGKTLSFDGDLSGAGQLDKVGDGVLALGSASSAYTGRLTVSDGELRLTAANVLRNATITQTGGTLTFAAGGTPENPVEVVLPDLAGSGGQLDLAPNVIAVLVYDAADDLQTYNGRLRGDGGIRKQGAGQLLLTNDNDFTGTAEVSQGSLVVAEGGAIGGPAVVMDGAMLVVNGTARGAVQVGSGGSLAGAGVIAGLTTVDGTHRPGNSPGIQTFTSGITYANGSTFEWDLIGNTATGRGTAYDGVDVTGGLLRIDPGASSLLRFNLTDSLVDWNDPFWSIGQSWRVFDTAIPPSGAFGAPAITVDGFGNSLTAARPASSFSWQQQGDDLVLVYAVPEPTTLGLAAVAAAVAALGGARHCRRRRSA